MPAYLVELPEVGGLTLPQGADKMVVFAADAANARAMAAAQFDGDANAIWQDAVTTVTEIVAGLSDEFFGDDTSVFVLLTGGATEHRVEVKGTSSHFSMDETVAVNAAGTGYATDDILTLSGGTFQRAATYRVTGQTAGVIDSLELVDPGDYSVAPTTLVGAALTGGTGSNATADVAVAAAGSHEHLLGGLVTALNAEGGIANAAVDMSDGAAGARLVTTTGAADNLGDSTLVFEIRRNGTAIPQLVGTITDGGAAGAATSAGIPALASIEYPSVTPVKGT